MSLPFNTIATGSLDGGTNGPQGVFIQPGTKKVYCVDNQNGSGTHLMIVDFTSGTGVPGSIVTLAEAVGTSPVGVGAGNGW